MSTIRAQLDALPVGGVDAVQVSRACVVFRGFMLGITAA
jgi:hypothetical protein